MSDTDVRACECGSAVTPTLGGWIHTNGSYRCPLGQSSEDGYAFPIDPDASDEQLREQWEAGYSQGEEDARDEYEADERKARETALADAIRAIEAL